MEHSVSITRAASERTKQMHKAIALSDAVEKIPDGASVMIGGFLGVGSPHRIIAELVRQGRKSLTVIANDTARPGSRHWTPHCREGGAQSGRVTYWYQPGNTAADHRQ